MREAHEKRYDNLNGSKKYEFIALDNHIEELQKQLEILQFQNEQTEEEIKKLELKQDNPETKEFQELLQLQI